MVDGEEIQSGEKMDPFSNLITKNNVNLNYSAQKVFVISSPQEPGMTKG